MVALTRPQHLTLPLPTLAAGASGGVVALAFLFMPTGMLEGMVLRSGIPAVLAAAEPPLGITARIALALLLGGLVAGFTWFGTQLLDESKVMTRRISLDGLFARIRRGDVHPDAPPRPPLFANRDLGTPFMGVKAMAPDVDPPAERDLPLNLDQPMATFDPQAILEVPLPAPEPVAPLKRPQLIDPGDRFETFELTAMQRLSSVPPEPEAAAPVRPLSLRVPSVSDTPAPRAVVAPETEASVHALLERLERGLAARDPRPEPAPTQSGGLSDALNDLRRLATGVR